MYDRDKASVNLPVRIASEWEPMENVTSCKYLVSLWPCSNLNWSEHVSNFTGKARRFIGMLYRQFYRWSSPADLSRLYVSLGRPHLKHAAPAWNPYLIRDINSLESVQRFALKVCLKQWNTPFNQLLIQACGAQIECLCRSKEITATSLLWRSAMYQSCMKSIN